MNVYVTNNGKEELIDGWDSVKYTFTPGKTVEVPLAAAEHIFGYGTDDKTPFLVRLGWMKMSNEYDAGMKRLAAFAFSETQPKGIHSPSPVDKGQARVGLQIPTLAKSDHKIAVSSA